MVPASALAEALGGLQIAHANSKASMELVIGAYMERAEAALTGGMSVPVEAGPEAIHSPEDIQARIDIILAERVTVGPDHGFLGALSMTTEQPAQAARKCGPRFGDPVMGIWASPDNPQRIGMFVRKGRRTGRMNAGPYWEVTDGEGHFWEYPTRSVVATSGYADPDYPAHLARLATRDDVPCAPWCATCPAAAPRVPEED